MSKNVKIYYKDMITTTSAAGVIVLTIYGQKGATSTTYPMLSIHTATPNDESIIPDGDLFYKSGSAIFTLPDTETDEVVLFQITSSGSKSNKYVGVPYAYIPTEDIYSGVYEISPAFTDWKKLSSVQ